MGRTVTVTERLPPLTVYVTAGFEEMRPTASTGRPKLSKSIELLAGAIKTPFASATLKLDPVAGSVTVSPTALHGARASAVRQLTV
jgi:hypothetical protein